MSEYFSKHNALNFVIPGYKIQNLLWRIKNLKFHSNSTLSCISILCAINNVDHNSPEEIVSGLNFIWNFVQAQCHCAKVVIIPLVPRDKKFPLTRANINTINSLLESECPKYNLYTYKHEIKWLNADGPLDNSVFYSDNLVIDLVKERNELLAKEIVAFYKYLKSRNYPTTISYKNVASLYLKESDFPTLKTCYSNYASSKVNLNWTYLFKNPLV